MQEHRRNQTERHPTRLGITGRQESLSDLLPLLGAAVYATRVDGLIKIGFTGNLKNRLANLGGFPGILAFRLNATVEDEQEIHERLQGRAVKGREWYAPDDPEVLSVINEMRDALGLSLLDAA
jgi:hypothetical protein